MQVNDVITFMVENSGATYNGASEVLGKSREYVRQAATTRRGPALATTADVADVCGYDVLIRERRTGSEAVITPPRREGAGDPGDAAR